MADYLDAPGNPEYVPLAKHMEECEKCREEYGSLMDILHMVKSVEYPDPGRRFWRDQRKKIREALGNELYGLLQRILRRAGGHGTVAAPVTFRPAVSLVMLALFIVSLIFLRGNGGDGMDLSKELYLAFDEKLLGDVYLSEILLPDSSLSDELDSISERELLELLADFRSEYGEEMSGEIFPIGSGDFDIEGTIGDLDRGELIRLLELLNEIPAKS